MVVVDHVTVEIGLADVVHVHVVVMMVEWIITARNGRGGYGDWILGVVWDREHGLIDVFRVFGSCET